jgi:hypothetical protein
MIHPKSLFVWKLLDPLLKYLQFPWRFLIIVAFFISLGSGAIVSLIEKRKKIVWTALVLLVAGLNFSYFRPESFVDTTQSLYLSGDNLKRQINRSIFDYLPIFAKFPPAEISTQNYEISEGECRIQNFYKGTDWILFEAVSRSGCKVVLSQYYFPGWEVYVNNSKVNIDYLNDLGLMTVDLPAGQSTLKARLSNTPVRAVSNLLTVISMVFLVYIVKMRL